MNEVEEGKINEYFENCVLNWLSSGLLSVFMHLETD